MALTRPPSQIDLIRADEQRIVNDGRNAPVAGITQAPVGYALGSKGFLGGLGGMFRDLPFQSSGSTGGGPIYNKGSEIDQFAHPGEDRSVGQATPIGMPDPRVNFRRPSSPWASGQMPSAQSFLNKGPSGPTQDSIYGAPPQVHQAVIPHKDGLRSGRITPGRVHIVGENGPEIIDEQGNVMNADDYFKMKDPSAVTGLDDLSARQIYRSPAMARLARSRFLLDAARRRLVTSGSVPAPYTPYMPQFSSFEPPHPSMAHDSSSQLTEAEEEVANAGYASMIDPAAGTHSWDDSTPMAVQWRGRPMAQPSFYDQQQGRAQDNILRNRGAVNRMYPGGSSVQISPTTNQYVPTADTMSDIMGERTSGGYHGPAFPIKPLPRRTR